MRFRSDASAVIFSVTATYDHDNAFGGNDRASAAARVGVRRYSRTADRTRPFRTLSITAGHTELNSSNATSAGVGAEFGAAHFFSPHVSLGASGEMAASVAWTKTTSPLSTASNTAYGVRIGSFRIFGGVYF